MPDHLISRLIGEMSKWTVPFYFAPFKLSEPLLDVRLQSICEKFEADCPNGTLRIFTNGSPLTPKHVEWIGRLKKLSHLWISLNEYRADEYQKLMALPFERTQKNLDYLHGQVESGNFKQDVVISAVAPVPEFYDYCQDRWPLFNLQGIKKDAWLGFTDTPVKIVPPTPCFRWFELSITAEGLCSMCCMTDGSKPEHIIGDLNKQTLLEVYNSDFWRERREKLMNRRQLDICRSCTY
jgi:hypothetical protein